jgi:hypothetical protein
MAQKMIYVRDEDLALFDRAAELGEDSLSAVIAEALRRFVATEEARKRGFEEITLKVGVWRPQGDNDTRPIKFLGRKLAEGTVYRGETGSRDDRGTHWAIYQTQAGKIVVRWDRWSRWQGEADVADYAVLDRIPAYDEWIYGKLHEDTVQVPGDILQEAAKELGQELAEWIE